MARRKIITERYGKVDKELEAKILFGENQPQLGDMCYECPCGLEIDAAVIMEKTAPGGDINTVMFLSIGGDVVATTSPTLIESIMDIVEWQDGKLGRIILCKGESKKGRQFYYAVPDASGRG